MRRSSLEICAGGGGSALGLERAGFHPALLIDNLPEACETLRFNRPHWDVRNIDLEEFNPLENKDLDDLVHQVDLLSAGLPRVQAMATVHRPRGTEKELKLLRATALLIHAVKPKVLLIENVPNLADNDKYRAIRTYIEQELAHLQYRWTWFVIDAQNYGVPQRRRQGMLVALSKDVPGDFRVPEPQGMRLTVSEVLGDSMASRGWPDVDAWRELANDVAPTIVGGSRERGGPDLGPTGAKRRWEKMGINGHSVGDEIPNAEYKWDPSCGYKGFPKLTIDQVAKLQSFPEEWIFSGKKTVRYSQVGNACPPLVAHAVGLEIQAALAG
ncbi:DNA cytosine methyltransferase [Pseudonocardiaceae bacterium YIM PH 21723]|nr:DNA cytosine methyltransferase [Pseudonocardiaceae bacterium YIM PH 21723]